MKNLKIIYGDQVLFDAQVDELVWTDNASGVKVEGRSAATKPSPGGGLLDILSGLSKARTEQKREELSVEPAEVVEAVDPVEAEPIFVGAAAE